MSGRDAELNAVVEKIVAELGPPSTWPSPILLNGLALCVMNSIYSTGNRSSGVIGVLDRYRDHRRSAGADPEADGTVELVTVIEACGGPDGFAEALRSRWRAWPRKSAPYKTEAILQAAQLLASHGIDNRKQLQVALDNQATHNELKRSWLNVPGQSSGLTWRFFLMNTGMPGIKADRMIIRWTSRAVGHRIAGGDAEAVLTEAAALLGADTRELDHAIWAHERNRP